MELRIFQGDTSDMDVPEFWKCVLLCNISKLGICKQLYNEHSCSVVSSMLTF